MKLLVSLVVVLAATGCATWSTSSVDSKAVDASNTATSGAVKTSLEAIRITDTDIFDRKYTSLGDITVNVNKTTVFHPNPTPALVNDKLKEKAHELGADAVILVRYGQGGISLMSWGSMEGKGRAVRYAK